MKTIPLTQGQVAFVDDADYEAVSKFKWTAMKTRNGFYAYRKAKGKNIYLHKFLLPKAKYVDHQDGNRLNCQRYNLRPCTQRQNCQAFRTKRRPTLGCPWSPYRGVKWDKTGKNWAARIIVNGKEIWLGGFDDDKDAARAYDIAAHVYFGDFACPNFPL